LCRPWIKESLLILYHNLSILFPLLLDLRSLFDRGTKPWIIHSCVVRRETGVGRRVKKGDPDFIYCCPMPAESDVHECQGMRDGRVNGWCREKERGPGTRGAQAEVDVLVDMVIFSFWDWALAGLQTGQLVLTPDPCNNIPRLIIYQEKQAFWRN